MQKQILSGCEAVARGAWEAGVRVAAAYPGTPSTEILENLGAFASKPPAAYSVGDGLYATWANNEAIAAEIAYGASVGGSRALVSMKHVGMNVAADAIFSGAYAGVNGGLVIVCCDDPGCYSSQNEQDNRLYAPHAKLIMLEPSDSQETLDFTKAAFELSETYDLPVMVRMTTRVCHSKSIVTLGERVAQPVRAYVGDRAKYAMLPANAKKRHVIVEDNLARFKRDLGDSLAQFTKSESASNAEGNGTLVITSGMSYMHVKEAFGDSVAVMKLGVTFPLSEKLLRDTARAFDRVCVVEEGEPYLATAISAMGVDAAAPSFIQGELSAARVREAFGVGSTPLFAMPEQSAPANEAPPRPPVMCAGCPHRGFYYALSRRKGKYVGVGDIGCYTLGVNAPFNGIDMCICMGSGFSIPIGLSKALEAQGDTRKVFGICGDSTFFHSGYSSLVDAVHQRANVCLVVLDNSITAMTGHQENSGTELHLMGYDVPKISIESMILATGLPRERLLIVNPLNLEETGAAIDAAISNSDGVTVIITKYPCALLKESIKARGTRHCEVDADVCVGCKMCMRAACPSLAFDAPRRHAYIADTQNCTACGLCRQLCKVGAIKEVA
ncbi:MAG: indolepyruvate ferredoxin oxidoreductase subunit alpha [Oscillospiraceae bacterium]|jgi:indolepyruvate ferredoxin oxidoreductase alpha subunit|nr:indolepyruvate ferredoxin oxidoreductase subunit alpha [Oscillospiraceae bacterium]